MRVPSSLRILPTRRLALIIGLVAPIWILVSYIPSGTIVAGFAIAAMVAAVIADVVRLPPESGFALSRHAPDTIGLSEAAEGEYRLVSTWNRSAKLTLFDRMPGPIRRSPPATPEFAVPPGAGTILPFELTASRRGIYDLGPVALRISGPLQLVRRTLRFRFDDRITVAPSLSHVHRFRLLALQHQLRQAGIRAMRRRGDGRSFAALREYAVGDDPRIIDWKHSARRGKLISREFTVERGQTVMIAIDSGRMMTQLAGNLPRFEIALSAALVLSAVAAASGDRVGLIVFDDQIRAYVAPIAGVAATRAIRDALIAVEPTLAEPDYSSAFATLARRQRSRALIVFFTDVIDSRASRSVIANTAAGARRHLPLVVALRSDALFEAAVPAPAAEADSLYRSAAAEELVLARGEALQAMRRAGAAVVDVSPGTATAAVVNRYLEIKARGAL